jgi:predicted CXXCH cytochrome family protein
VVRALLVIVVALVGACGGDAVAPAPLPAPIVIDAGAIATAAPGPSTIYRADYVGPEPCRECHAANYAGWRATPHAVMTQPATSRSVRGDFAGAELRYAGGTARFRRDGDGFVMELVRDDLTRRFRVTRTIGSLALQEYVGVETAGPEAGAGQELRLPFGYWLRAGRWLPRPYYDSWFPDEYRPDGSAVFDPFVPDAEPWAARCAWCHNTYPFELRVLRSSAKAIGQGLEQFVELAPVRRAAASVRAVTEANLLPTDELVTDGISCESCHGGLRDHVRDDAPVRFVPASGDLHLLAGAPDLRADRKSPIVINAICAQCHSTPSPTYPDGAAARNSSESLAMARGACRGAITCVHCHDPHASNPEVRAGRDARANRACVGCHQAYAPVEAARAHAHHDAVTCVDCHMPKLVAGVASFVRSHRISSPTDPDMLAAAAPNACNLCHLDRSIAWTLAQLPAWGASRLVPDDRWRLAYGARGLDAPLGPAWLASASGTARITAAAAYARAGDRAALPRLLRRLDSAVAYDRMFTLFAIEDLLGRRLARDEYDPLAAPAQRRVQVRVLEERLR